MDEVITAAVALARAPFVLLLVVLGIAAVSFVAWLDNDHRKRNSSNYDMEDEWGND